MNWLAQVWDRYRRTPKALRWVAWPVVLLLAAYVIEDWRGRKAQADFFAKWNAAGIPLSWEDVGKAYTPPGPEDDFLEAPIIADYIQGTTNYSTRLLGAQLGYRLTDTERKRSRARVPPASSTGTILPIPFDLSDPTVRSDEDQARHILSVLGPQAGLLDEVAEAVQRPQRRWAMPEAGFGSDIYRMEDHMVDSSLNSVAKVLHARARANLYLGHHEDALRDVITLLHISRVQLHPVTMLLGQVYFTEEGLQTLELVWEGLHREAWDEAQLAELAAALSELHPAGQYPEALQFESAVGNWMYHHPATRRYAIRNALYPNQDTEAKIWAGVMMWVAPKGAVSQLEIASTRILAEEIVAPGGPKSRELRVEHLDRYKARLAAPAGSFYDYLLKKNVTSQLITGWGFKNLLVQQTLDLARIAVALERWRLREGRYPKALADLVPRHLPMIPEDRFVPGRAVVYMVISGDNYQLHACGQNRVDDGAKVERNADVVWRLRP